MLTENERDSIFEFRHTQDNLVTPSEEGLNDPPYFYFYRRVAGSVWTDMTWGTWWRAYKDQND